ncbi:hypothetical protein BJ170DRAFT_682791 [Xylariales sp. AK1849]|nr:hypothetical protein BJ170DRAFT_682791 [Xylariales sp. AK1849]
MAAESASVIVTEILKQILRAVETDDDSCLAAVGYDRPSDHDLSMDGDKMSNEMTAADSESSESARSASREGDALIAAARLELEEARRDLNSMAASPLPPANNTWHTPERKGKRKHLGRRGGKWQRRQTALAAQTGRYAMDLTEDPNDYPLIRIQELQKAIHRVTRLTDPHARRRGDRGPVGAAVVYKRRLGEGVPWLHRSFAACGITSPSDADPFAIERALHIAFVEALLYCQPPTPEGEETLPIVYILADSQDSLHSIRKRLSVREVCWNRMVEYVVWAMKRLQDVSIRVELTWAPGHVGLEDNEIAGNFANCSRQFILARPSSRNGPQRRRLEFFQIPVLGGVLGERNHVSSKLSRASNAWGKHLQVIRSKPRRWGRYFDKIEGEEARFKEEQDYSEVEERMREGIGSRRSAQKTAVYSYCTGR